MTAGSTLSPTAGFWLDSLHLFDPRRDGPHWDQPICELIEQTVQSNRDLADLVRDAIVIQQFLLELLTRREVDRGDIMVQVRSLLTADER